MKNDLTNSNHIILNTREIALMIQLEQQQHGEFWVGWWVGWWVTYQLPISSSLCGWINKVHNPTE